MKKILVAAVAAATLTGAYAQSNVVLYGELDAGIGQRYNQEDVGFVSNYEGTNRWGLRGTEDLGNGLKANFNFESGAINLGNGAIGGNGGFNRQAWVGLSGAFGSIIAGRTTTPQNRITGAFDLNATAGGTSALAHVGLGANGSMGGSRQDNQLQYAIPTIHGFDARIAYVFEDDRPGEQDNAFIQAAASYKIGGLLVAGVVQSKMSDAEGHRTGYALGAKYDFDFLVLSAYYNRRETRIGGEGFGLGAAVPIGNFTIGVQAALLTDSDSDLYEDAMALEVFTDYALSKRTRLYANFGTLNDEAEWFNGSTNATTGVRTRSAEDMTFGLGMVHLF